MKSPLIHIGYHKTASTWLQRQFFSKQDDFAVLDFDKALYQIHPFQFEAQAQAIAQKYAEKLDAVDPEKVPVLSNERLSGHPHSGGHDSKEIADRLAEVFPGARILIVIREQKSAILSSYYQYVKKGGLCSLAHYVGPRRDGHVPLFHPDHFCYDGLIAYYFGKFGRERVCVVSYELFRDEPELFLEALLQFTGVAPGPMPAVNRKINASAPPVTVWMKSCLNIFIRSDTVNACSPYASWLGAAIFLPVVTAAGRITPRFVNTILARRWQHYVDTRFDGYFEASNLRTKALTGIDLNLYDRDRGTKKASPGVWKRRLKPA